MKLPKVHKKNKFASRAAYDNSFRSFFINSGAEAVLDEHVEMVLDEYGFYKALNSTFDTDSKHNHIANILAVNAMADESPDENSVAKKLFSSIPGINHDSDIGYYLSLYAGHVAEGDFRSNASSGGIATWLLVKLFEEGLIDGVIHVKESDKADGVLFKYAISTTIDEIKDGSKSRYYPAEFSKQLKFVKKNGGKFAVTGIPSLIFELRLLSLIDPKINDSIAYTFGLICGHQKSAKYAEALAWQHGIAPGNLKSIDFRKKKSSGLAYEYLTEMTGYKDNSLVTLLKEQHEFFISDWGHGFFKSKLSDYTDDALNETADISLGDAWLGEYVEDYNGNNVLIVRNPDLNRIITEGISSGALKLDKISEDTVKRSQSGLIHHTRREISYRLFKLDKNDKWYPIKRIAPSKSIPFLRRRVQDLRQQISIKSHTVYVEAVKRNDWMYFENKLKIYTLMYDLIYRYIRFRQKRARNAVKKLMNLPIKILKRKDRKYF